MATKREREIEKDKRLERIEEKLDKILAYLEEEDSEG